MKRIIIGFISAFLLLSVILSLSSCDFDESKKKFSGGELLDRERLSEIKGELSESEKESAPEERETESERIESNTETEAEATTKADESDIKTETVYWTEGGSVWHLTPQCSRLSKSKEIISGTVSEAKEAKKERVCSFCGK